MKTASDTGWEKLADANFVYVPAQDANCTAANTAVLFDVNPVNANGQYLMRAFFPDSPRNERNVLSLLQSRLIASVQLIAALGGGWDGQLQVSDKE